MAGGWAGFSEQELRQLQGHRKGNPTEERCNINKLEDKFDTIQQTMQKNEQKLEEVELRTVQNEKKLELMDNRMMTINKRLEEQIIHLEMDRAAYYLRFQNIIESRDEDLNREDGINPENIEQYLKRKGLPEIKEEQKEILNKEIIIMELKRVVERQKNNKTPGPDGLPAELYKCIYECLEPVMLDVYNEVLDFAKLPDSWRDANISLIPKEDLDHKQIKNYRPISLLNADYKIFATIMSERLKIILNELIHIDQNGFLPSGQIRNNTRIVLNVLEYYEAHPGKQKEQTKFLSGFIRQPYLLFKSIVVYKYRSNAFMCFFPRSKRTQAETVKLKRIQKQLQALDDMVSADIGILRNRIDQASLEYSCARKRYDKAESEYVTAKLDLQKKTEVKEQLAEHLSTIIQQNELRKAKKLEELMKELEVEADEENLELEVEVEQMLQQQETEARRQEIETQKLAQVDVQCTDSQTLSKGHENDNFRNINGAA
ncbi:RAB6-interacting golgin [Notechis scutatus]|uniref:RAB6-interacting golgin n=1 Tax=Notechis scutatus TaxID=8663 RepID=A0A6J1VDL8_9SAUR|nr:RAB6-interacting golgin [Notechis scutatus]